MIDLSVAIVIVDLPVAGSSKESKARIRGLWLLLGIRSPVSVEELADKVHHASTDAGDLRGADRAGSSRGRR